MTLVPGPHCQASTWALEGGGGVWGGGCCWHGFAGGHVGDPSPLKGAPICLLGASLARASHLGHAGSRAILSGRGAGTRAMGKMAADVTQPPKRAEGRNHTSQAQRASQKQHSFFW